MKLARLVERALGAAGLVTVLFLVAKAVLQTPDLQWDFRGYYYAALAGRASLDPYDYENIVRTAGAADVQGYLYPPLMLSAFQPLTHLAIQSAQHVWLVLGTLALVALGWVVSRHVLGRVLDPFLWAVVLLAWDYVIQIVIAIGNLEVYVQLAVWTAVAALLAGRSDAFIGLVTLAALPKGLGGSYALGLLALDWRRYWPDALTVAAGWVGWCALNMLVEPEWTASWLMVATDASRPGSEPARSAPSLLWLTHSLLGDRESTWVVVAALSIAAAWRASVVLRRAQAVPLVGRLLFAVTTVTLLWPRLKDYAYFAFIPPAAWLARDLAAHGGVRRWFLVAAVVLLLVGRAFWTAVPLAHPATVADVAVAYVPWLLAFALWVVFVAHLWTYRLGRAERHARPDAEEPQCHNRDDPARHADGSHLV